MEYSIMLVVDGEKYYQAQEVADAVGVVRNTLLRWISKGRVPDAAVRNRNNWRCFDKNELKVIKRYADKSRK